MIFPGLDLGQSIDHAGLAVAARPRVHSAAAASQQARRQQPPSASFKASELLGPTPPSALTGRGFSREDAWRQV
jgi:hypothetical protein